MKLLIEQRKLIEERIHRINAAIGQTIEEKKDIDIPLGSKNDYAFEYSYEIKNEIVSMNAEKERLVLLLSSNETVTKYNTKYIDVGSEFVLSFDGMDEDTKFTLIDLNIDKFSSVNGYITKKCPLGSAVYGKQVGDEFSYVIADETVTGVISNIVMKYPNCTDKVEDVVLDEVIKEKTEEPYVEYTPGIDFKFTNSKSRRFVTYKEKLEQVKDNKRIQQELERMNRLTVTQRKIIDNNKEKYQSANIRKKYIEAEAISNARNDITDIGHSIYLELTKDSKSFIKNVELVGVLDVIGDNSLSIKKCAGFDIYRVPMGESVTVKNIVDNSKWDCKVIQFGINGDDLLYKGALNTRLLSVEDKKITAEHNEYQNQKVVKMTASQYELFQLELQKINSSFESNSYTNHVLDVERKLANSEIELVDNSDSDSIEIGSKIKYVINDNDIFVEVEKEVIETAFTTEDSSNYIETMYPLGATFLGKKLNSDISVVYNDKVTSATVVDIDNNSKQLKKCR